MDAVGILRYAEFQAEEIISMSQAVLRALMVAIFALVSATGCKSSRAKESTNEGAVHGSHPTLYHSLPNCDTAEHLEAVVRLVVENGFIIELALPEVNATAGRIVCIQHDAPYPLVFDKESLTPVGTLSYRERAYAYIRKVRIMGIIIPIPDMQGGAKYRDMEANGGARRYQYIIEPNRALNAVDWAIIRGQGVDAQFESDE